MATGDAATAAGFPLVAATDDKRLGYDEINKTRDLLAAEQTARIAADNLKLASTKVRVQTAATARPASANVGDVLIRY